MTSQERDDITLVLPTYNRAAALRANLGSMLAIADVADVIVVDDGSTDDTQTVCGEFSDPRLRVIRHPRNRGVAAARNTGIDAAAGGWILFGEDDCRFPVEYASVLRAEAERLQADIVGAPLIHTFAAEADIPSVAAAAPRKRRPTMEDSGVFPCEAIESPFMTALTLVRRSVFDRLRYHEDYAVNGYREETDFFVQAARAGFRCVLTPATYGYQLQTWDGGQHQTSTLRYEYWAMRNNWRFLRRHGAWLSQQGYISGVAAAQMKFAVGRARGIVLGKLYARTQQARKARQASAATPEPAATPESAGTPE